MTHEDRSQDANDVPRDITNDLPRDVTSRTRAGDSLGTRSEDGSLVTEYGLLAVVAATIAGVVIQWATGGAVVGLFNAMLDQARSLVGA